LGKTYSTSRTGSYHFSVIGDDHANIFSRGTGGPQGGKYPGNIDYVGDIDWFIGPAHVCCKYTITARSLSLKGIKVELYVKSGSSNGRTLIASSSGQRVAKIEWPGIVMRFRSGRMVGVTRSTSGSEVAVRAPVYIKVTSFLRNGTGSYNLSIKGKPKGIVKDSDIEKVSN